MGRLRTLEQLSNKIAPQYGNIHLVPRGIPYYIDPILRGSARFARKIGNDLALLNPDNTMFLTTSVQNKKDELSVDRLLNWLEVGAILRIGRSEYQVIRDFSEDTSTGTNILFMDEALQFDHDTKEPISIHAVPMLMVGTYAKGSTEIIVRSKYELFLGDVFVYLASDELLGSQVEREIINAEFLSTSPHPLGFDYNYKLTMDEITKDLANDSVVYVRAYPAYKSKILNVPTNFFSISSIGPFLVDYISGRLSDGTPIEEFLGFETYNQFHDVLQPMRRVGKHFPVTNMSVRSDVMLFWDLIAGKFQYGNKKVSALCDADGHFACVQKMAPHMPPGTKWNIVLEANRESKVNFYFHPNEVQSFDMAAGETRTVTVGTESTDESIERLEISIASDENGIVTFGDWQPMEAQTYNVSYSLVGRAVGEAVWQSSGLLIKPYFLNLDYISTRYDTGRRYDGGLIYL